MYLIIFIGLITNELFTNRNYGYDIGFVRIQIQIRFIFTSKTNEYLLNYWIINEKININEKVLEWRYYNHLTNIKINKLLEVYPKKLQ